MNIFIVILFCREYVMISKCKLELREDMREASKKKRGLAYREVADVGTLTQDTRMVPLQEHNLKPRIALSLLYTLPPHTIGCVLTPLFNISKPRQNTNKTFHKLFAKVLFLFCLGQPITGNIILGIR